MQYHAGSVEEYIHSLPDNRRRIIHELRQTILKNLPEGFMEVLSYGMIGYVVPHSVYPKGYHVDPKQPLPFLSIASQKNHIAVYHMGIYSDKPLLEWFTHEFPRYSSQELDMGKSCIRFKKPEHVPLDLLAELVRKMTVQEWIERYERSIRK